MKRHRPWAFAVLALSLGIVALAAEAGPLAGAADSGLPMAAAFDARHLMHDVADKKGQCWCVNPGGSKGTAACWRQCCRVGQVSRCYTACFPSEGSCRRAPAPGVGTSPGGK